MSSSEVNWERHRCGWNCHTVTSGVTLQGGGGNLKAHLMPTDHKTKFGAAGVYWNKTVLAYNVHIVNL